MKYSVFSVTNSESERSRNFIANSIKKNNFIINLLSDNKHKHPLINFLIYISFSPLVVVFFIISISFKKYEKKVVVLFPGILELVVLNILKPILKIEIYYDAFTSLYLTLVNDRNVISKNNPLSYLILKIDKIFFRLSDFQFVETNEMKEYFNNVIEVDVRNTYVLYTPRQQFENFKTIGKVKKVIFWGNFASMHGIDYIIEAAEILQKDEIIFELIGSGDKYLEIKSRIKKQNLSNINLYGYLPYFSKNGLCIVDLICDSTLCLGTFSNSIKNNLVIPHKIIEALSLKKPVLTASTESIVRNLKGVVEVVKPCEGVKLAEKIKDLVFDEKKLNKMSKKSFECYLEKFSDLSFQNNLLNLS